MRRLVIACALVVGGCRFQVDAVILDAGTDASTIDAASDASGSTSFVPSHVSPSDVVGGAASLTGFSDVDTDALTIDGHAPPPGVVFQAEPGNDNWAVLSVKDLTVSNDVSVHGRRALIVVAVGTIELDAVLHAEAKLRTPGPGGSYTGMGVGGDGKTSGSSDSAGGGAGHGGMGAPGGNSDAMTNPEGGAGGAMYGLLDDLVGGSGGGNGAGALGTMGGTPCPMDQSWSAGGAGGGVIQLSAKVQLQIAQAGGVDASGGGGRGGCHDAPSAGGGGGSGGTVWLEAPTMTLDGTIAANGGAGGSGGRNSMFNMQDGNDGQDGLFGVQPAMGGMSVSKYSGAGGNGGAGTITPTNGSDAMNAGGGGGAIGAIRIRTRGVSPVTSSTTVLSPAPQKSVDF